MSVLTQVGKLDVELSVHSVDTLESPPESVPSDAVVPESSPQLTSIKATAPNAKNRVNFFFIFPPRKFQYVFIISWPGHAFYWEKTDFLPRDSLNRNDCKNYPIHTKDTT